jgi:hypothetical protein
VPPTRGSVFHAEAELVTLVNGKLALSEDYDKAFKPFYEE